MRKRVFQKTQKEHALKIERAKAAAQRRAEAALSIDEISRAQSAYANAAFSNTDDTNHDKIVESARLTYQNALKKYGFDEKEFEYRPICPICGDTGSVNGKPCKCIFDEYIANLKKACDIDARAKFSFADCDLKKVKDETQRKSLATLYSAMQKYVEKFPKSECSTIVFSGGVGTGKTCLASAIARAVVEKGYAAKIMSAYEFNSLMLKIHTSPIAERNALIHDVITADLLLIDDLGTEPMLKNVTVEYLLLVIEERQTKGRATVITTNLDTDGILFRYGERIYSRLSHKQHSKIIEMNGKDLRINR